MDFDKLLLECINSFVNDISQKQHGFVVDECPTTMIYYLYNMKDIYSKNNNDLNKNIRYFYFNLNKH